MLVLSDLHVLLLVLGADVGEHAVNDATVYGLLAAQTQ